MFEVSGVGVGGSFLFFSGAGCLLLLLLAGGVGCLLLLLLLLDGWLLLIFVATASGARLCVSAGASGASGVSIPFSMHQFLTLCLSCGSSFMRSIILFLQAGLWPHWSVTSPVTNLHPWHLSVASYLYTSLALMVKLYLRPALLKMRY